MDKMNLNFPSQNNSPYGGVGLSHLPHPGLTLLTHDLGSCINTKRLICAYTEITDHAYGSHLKMKLT